MVPLTENLLTIDYIQQQAYSVIIVTSGRLGSINHTLLSFAALRQYGIRLHSLISTIFTTAKMKPLPAIPWNILKAV